MATIQKLSPTLSNQIAAGEVIERPASVVKELVENAIDAKATQIDILVKDAGISQIQVIDNGVGIPAAEVGLAFEPHATSKISATQDLFNVRTLGFRGEALASIAAVSKVKLITSTDGMSGKQIDISGGTQDNLQTVAANQGTNITVSDLFYNTPARLKYLKTINTELNQVVNIINRLALGNPQVAFNLANEHKTLIRTSGNGNLQQAVAGIYDRQTAAKLVAIKEQDNDFAISGYISLPENTRANRNYISLLLNGRYITNYQLIKAVLAGYGSKLMVGRYPIGIIAIETDPLLVDVNVHPTKREVRLSKEEQLTNLLTKSIQQSLGQLNLIPEALPTVAAKSSEVVPIEPVFTTNKISEPEPDTPIIASNPTNKMSLIADGAVKTTPIFEDPEHLAAWDARMKKLEPVADNDEVADFSQLDIAAKETNFPQLQYLTQIHETYLVAQSNDGFYLVDQHAANERLNYEKYRAEVGQVEPDQQKLLVPLVLNYSNADALIVSECLEMLQNIGLDIAPFGQNSFVVTSYPTWIEAQQEEKIIRELVDYALRDGKINIAKFREQVAITMSCKLAIKANQHLDNAQAQAILDQLAQTKNPYNCPHGRPTLVHFSDQDIQKMFKRIQDSHQSQRKK